MTKHRNPCTIAAELTYAAANLPTAFMPGGVRDALALLAEFTTSTTAHLVAAGVIDDPAATGPDLDGTQNHAEG